MRSVLFKAKKFEERVFLKLKYHAVLTFFFTKNKLFKNQLIEKLPKKGFLKSKIDFAFCTTMFIVFGFLLQGCISRLETTYQTPKVQGCKSGKF